MGTLSERDYLTYCRVFDIVVGELPSPDLLIYLRAPVPVLLDRIRERGREMESIITAEYLELLESLYKAWLQNFDICPVLTLRTDNLDFVHKPKHLEIVVEWIHDELLGKEEFEFPAN